MPHPMPGNMPNISATCVSTTTVKQAAPKSTKNREAAYMGAIMPACLCSTRPVKFKLRHYQGLLILARHGWAYPGHDELDYMVATGVGRSRRSHVLWAELPVPVSTRR